ncbi:SDR family oxidoreductase [Candidatus Latescibacterota bacterium]
MKYLVTGGAGFIGSNLVEALLERGDEVVVLDDLSTGKRANIEPFMDNSGFTFIHGSITNPETCAKACEGMDYVLQHAAMVSVPVSIKDPLTAQEVNVTGSVNIFMAAKNAGIKRVVSASSTSVYGNSMVLPNVENMPLSPLSPYAASKAAGEMYARAFSEVYDISIVSLRYFNVFGKRQDPFSNYSAVIPVFISKLLKGEKPEIYGDGSQTRDFVHIENIVQANLKAVAKRETEIDGHSFNIGCEKYLTINELYRLIAEELESDIKPLYKTARPGDVRDSYADIQRARNAFGYEPTVDVKEGLKRSIEWYKRNMV